jgi:enamine deaminase RidA (YjgF/YER057c/UK114 family)
VKALIRIGESLKLCGTDKSRIISAKVNITDMSRKQEMNRAWGRAGRCSQSANAGVHWCRS